MSSEYEVSLVMDENVLKWIVVTTSSSMTR